MRTFATLLPLCLGVALTAPAYAANVAISPAARTHFQAGVNLLTDQDGARYDEAYLEFRAAYDDSPSWKILSNLGLTAMKLERDGEALWAMETYLNEGGDQVDPEDRAQVSRDLETLRAGVAWVNLEFASPVKSLFDDRTTLQGKVIRNRYTQSGAGTKLGVRAGAHRFTVEFTDGTSATWEVELKPGGSENHRFDGAAAAPKPEVALATDGEAKPATEPAPAPAQPEPGKEGPAPLPVGAFVGIGVTAAAAISAGVFGIMALTTSDEFTRTKNATDLSASEQTNKLTSLKQQAATFALVSDISTGTAVVAGVVTAIVILTRPTTPPPATAHNVLFVPSVSPTSAGFHLQGSF